MRLAPVPLFFYRRPELAVKYSGRSALLTHGDEKAFDACRYYGALIAAALLGETKKQLLDKGFYEKHKGWFGKKGLHKDIQDIAEGSYQKKGGYDDGIRGKGYVVDSLRAALWAFWDDGESFEKGARAAVNLGDDTDTTAAIYGQLAGACYGYQALPQRWRDEVYAKKFIEGLSVWIIYEGDEWHRMVDENDSDPMPLDAFPSGSVAKDRPRRVSMAVPGTAKRSTLGVSSTDKRPKSSESPNAQSPANRKTSHHSENSDVYPFVSLGLYFLPGFETSKHVADWLLGLDKAFGKYAKTFLDQDIDAYWVLNQLDENQLEGKGVKDAGHRKRILQAIAKLKKDCPAKYASGTEATSRH
jgi:hypothetical protein